MSRKEIAVEFVIPTAVAVVSATAIASIITKGRCDWMARYPTRRARRGASRDGPPTPA